ncbi:MAG: MoaD/ThiS family protein [Bacteroidota bacterium]|nr:MoaD/ThiS family protein [Bacteroidota bacterium]
MVKIKFTYALKRFFPDLREIPAKGTTLRELFDEMEASYPKVRSYLMDEQGNLRKHVNVFIDGKMIEDRAGLSDPFTTHSEVYIMQALSGG